MIPVSIIVACRKISLIEQQCLEACSKLDYPNFEIIILPDYITYHSLKDNVKVVSTGNVRPSAKRNIGLNHSQHELIAFIDSDAYPEPSWLKNAIPYFSDEAVGLVGGPSLTPKEDNLWQQAGGLVLSSRIGGGKLAHRYTRMKEMEVDDLPSCNLLGRRDMLIDLVESSSHHWPGEDTYLCLQVKKKLKKKLIYSPNVQVFHHRRPLFKPHLEQVWAYGLHRGHFARKYPENSRKMVYFLPSTFVLVLLGGPILALLHPTLLTLYLLGIGSYGVVCLIEGLRSKRLRISLLVAVGIAITHLAYGLGFLRGLLSEKLPEDRRAILVKTNNNFK